jgi:hypothetical protein
LLFDLCRELIDNDIEQNQPDQISCLYESSISKSFFVLKALEDAAAILFLAYLKANSAFSNSLVNRLASDSS